MTLTKNDILAKRVPPTKKVLEVEGLGHVLVRGLTAMERLDLLSGGLERGEQAIRLCQAGMIDERGRPLFAEAHELAELPQKIILDIATAVLELTGFAAPKAAGDKTPDSVDSAKKESSSTRK